MGRKVNWYIINNNNEVLLYNHHIQKFSKINKSGLNIDKLIDIANLYERKIFQRHNFNDNYIEFAIVMTHNCNLECDYCFERGIKQNGEDEDIEKIIKYINKKIEAKSPEKIVLRFFGGELLLKVDDIARIIKSIKTFYEDLNIY